MHISSSKYICYRIFMIEKLNSQRITYANERVAENV